MTGDFPMPFRKRFKNELEQLRATWDAYSQKNISQTGAPEDFPFLSLALPGKTDLVLDVGCGAGNYMAMFSRFSDHVHGIDLSPKMIEYAQKHGHAVMGDMRAMPFEDNKFDYVCSIVAINYVPDWPKAVSEMARVLKPGGICIIAGANMYSFITPLRTLLHALGMYKHGKTFHTSIRAIRSAAEKNGLLTLKTTVKIKEVSSDTALRNIVYFALTGMDRILNRIFPWWGGDAIVMFTKPNNQQL